eukprot:snap_masked-scaffold_4-processed-gene-4.24-mRNA-1 protein AED:1.00 eAED:1.00 QI:0/0/0/0/1/1/2/0/291
MNTKENTFLHLEAGDGSVETPNHYTNYGAQQPLCTQKVKDTHPRYASSSFQTLTPKYLPPVKVTPIHQIALPPMENPVCTEVANFLKTLQSERDEILRAARRRSKVLGCLVFLGLIVLATFVTYMVYSNIRLSSSNAVGSPNTTTTSPVGPPSSVPSMLPTVVDPEDTTFPPGITEQPTFHQSDSLTEKPSLSPTGLPSTGSIASPTFDATAICGQERLSLLYAFCVSDFEYVRCSQGEVIFADDGALVISCRDRPGTGSCACPQFVLVDDSHPCAGDSSNFGLEHCYPVL